MIVRLTGAKPKWTDKHFRADAFRHPGIPCDRLLGMKPGIAHPINIRGGSPMVSAGAAIGETSIPLMGRRSVSSIGADENRRLHPVAKLLEITRENRDRSRDKQRRVTKEGARLAAIHENQFGQGKVGRKLELFGSFPRWRFIEKTRQAMN